MEKPGNENSQLSRQDLPTDFVFCVFPFKYKEDMYHGCTTVDKGRSWCATNENYSGNSWKWCEEVDYKFHSEGKVEEVNTYSAKQCYFPFTYNGNTFHGCTSLDHPRHKSWCFTKVQDIFEGDQGDTGVSKQSHIQDLCVVKHNEQVSTFGGTTNGEPCTFPFWYRGVKYNGCHNDECKQDGNDRRYACGLTEGDDSVGRNGTWRWGYCNVIDTVEWTDYIVQTTNKAWRDTTCVLPFVYNGEKMYSCIGEDTTPWCATSDNYDRDGKWKYCDHNDVISTRDVTRDENAARKNPQCSWPFVANGILRNEDMNLNDGKRYCSTTYNFDKDQKMMLSGRGDNQMNKCHYPFYYDGVIHHTCFEHWCLTDDGLAAGDHWINC